MSTMAYSPNPQLASGTGGAGMIQAPPQDDPNYQVPGLPAFGVPQGYGLGLSFPFPQNSNPLGGFTDEGYLADDASLRADIGQRYAAFLQQLGYQDPNTGNVIPGTIIQDANIKLSQYAKDLQDEQIQNTQQMQQAGTLFSGIRPWLLAQLQDPTQRNIGQLGLDTSRSLNDIYNQAQNLVTEYNTKNQQNLAAAAARNLQSIQNQQLLNALHPQTAPAPQGTVNPGGGGDVPAYDQTTWPSDSQTANIDYAQSPVGQSMVQQVAAHPASAGSSGAAGVLAAAAQGRNTPNYQARRNAY